MIKENEKTPEELFEDIVMDMNGKSLMDLLCHPDLGKFIETFDEVKNDWTNTRTKRFIKFILSKN